MSDPEGSSIKRRYRCAARLPGWSQLVGARLYAAVDLRVHGKVLTGRLGIAPFFQVRKEQSFREGRVAPKAAALGMDRSPTLRSLIRRAATIGKTLPWNGSGRERI